MTSGPEPGRCTIWVADLSARHVRGRSVDGDAQWLSRDELSRLDHYRQRDDAERFAVGAMLLRAAVADFRPGTDPQSVRIDRSCRDCGRQHGRPVIVDPGAPKVHVSVSHSGRYVLVALTDVAHVGVDVEQRSPALIDAATAICAPGERVETGDAAATLWVRKEALLKATGDGFRRDPTTVRVGTAHPAASAVWLDGGGPSARLYDVELGDDYAAAAAVLAPGPVELRIGDADDILSGQGTQR